MYYAELVHKCIAAAAACLFAGTCGRSKCTALPDTIPLTTVTTTPTTMIAFGKWYVDDIVGWGMPCDICASVLGCYSASITRC